MKKSFFFSILMTTLTASQVHTSNVQVKSTEVTSKHNLSIDDIVCLNWFGAQSRAIEFCKSAQLKARIKNKNLKNLTYKDNPDEVRQIEQMLVDEFFRAYKNRDAGSV